MGKKMKKKNLHVVVSVESFAANGARELGGADEDLGGCRDPILGLITRVSGGGRGGGGADMESHGDSILAIRVLEVLVLVVRREAAVVLVRVALARRP